VVANFRRADGTGAGTVAHDPAEMGLSMDLETLKAHCNVTGNADDAVLTRLLDAAQRQIERMLGYALDDQDELPDGVPADLEHAIYLLAAHYYENREASVIGVNAAPLPLGVTEVIAEHRRYTFGLSNGE